MDDPLFGLKQEDMKHRLEDVLHEGLKFEYEYDFGSTTELMLKVAGVNNLRVSQPDLKLIAQNNAPALACVQCGKPATLLEARGWGLEQNAIYCDACTTTNGIDNQILMPIVNSPRVGVCAYNG